MTTKTKGIVEYIINLALAMVVLGLLYQIRYLIELFYALFGRKISLKINTG